MTITKIAPGYCEHCEKARPLWIIAGAKLCRGCTWYALGTARAGG